MADEETQEAAPEANSGGAKKMILFGAAGLVLVIVGIFAGPAVMNLVSPPEEADAEATEEAADAPAKPAIYQSLHPPLVVNVKDAYGDPHFMQITMEVMGRDQEGVNAVREHTPAIRNALILMFGQAKYEEVITREGKEKMLLDARTEIQSVMTEQIGEPGIEEVYFTALVIQ